MGTGAFTAGEEGPYDHLAHLQTLPYSIRVCNVQWYTSNKFHVLLGVTLRECSSKTQWREQLKGASFYSLPNPLSSGINEKQSLVPL